MSESERELKKALRTLVDLYVQNQGGKYEFISCITPKNASSMTFQERRNSRVWRAFDDARDLLNRVLPMEEER